MTRDEWAAKYPGLDARNVEVPEGWTQLVTELFDTLNTKIKDWAYSHVTQIKEKFGGLRFYHQYNWESLEEVEHFVALAEQKSWTLCQKCGAEGATQVNVKRGWSLKTPPGPGPICTLCKACAAAEEAT